MVRAEPRNCLGAPYGEGPLRGRPLTGKAPYREGPLRGRGRPLTGKAPYGEGFYGEGSYGEGPYGEGPLRGRPLTGKALTVADALAGVLWRGCCGGGALAGVTLKALPQDLVGPVVKNAIF